MKGNVPLLSTHLVFALSLAVAGCAGTLTPDEQEQLFQAHAGTGGGTGSMIEMCVTNSMKSCQTMGCHAPIMGSTTVSAGLNLENSTIIDNFKTLVDKSNAGDPTAVMPCAPMMYKLIDSADAMNSLIYTKVTTVPCGTKMPQIGTFSDADRACVLNWINSAIMLSKAP
jgi:hypothetical protein